MVEIDIREAAVVPIKQIKKLLESQPEVRLVCNKKDVVAIRSYTNPAGLSFERCQNLYGDYCVAVRSRK
jgi:hypothetical protein